MTKGVDGKKTPVANCLLQCLHVKVHNDMIKSPAEGDFAGAMDKSDKVIISDTALRLNRPKNLKPMTNRHKQMCGCETCIVSKQLLLTLNEWRRRHVQRLENESRQRHDRYKQQLFFCQHKDVKSEMMSVMCEPCDGQTLPRWKCVIRSCKDCPEYAIPDEEKKRRANIPNIVFRVYKTIYKCSVHNFLPLGVQTCSVCDRITKSSKVKKGTVNSRKELTKMNLPIDKFITDYYLPMLEKLCYHLPHVIILSKHHCGEMRRTAILCNNHDLFTRRDYADRLVAAFELEIQSGHFGDNVTLSMEGCSVEFHKGDGEIKMHFHFHFADKSPQNANSTNAHMEVMIGKLLNQGLLTKRKSTVLEVTDGCGKQYRCGNALMLLSVLARKYEIIIDRAVDAPGHGKGVVDGIQGSEKNFIRRKMCMTNKNGIDSQEDRMEAAQISDDTPTSFA